jgi:hypothetical protein
MREAYVAEVLAAMRTPESQITEVGHHRDGVWRGRVRQRRTQMRAAALFDPREHTRPARERTRRAARTIASHRRQTDPQIKCAAHKSPRRCFRD